MSITHCLRYESGERVSHDPSLPGACARDRGARGQTFYCGIVLVDEMTLDELDGQATLADTATAHDDELVLPQELFRHDTLTPGRMRPRLRSGRRIEMRSGGDAIEAGTRQRYMCVWVCVCIVRGRVNVVGWQRASSVPGKPWRRVLRLLSSRGMRLFASLSVYQPGRGTRSARARIPAGREGGGLPASRCGERERVASSRQGSFDRPHTGGIGGGGGIEGPESEEA